MVSSHGQVTAAYLNNSRAEELPGAAPLSQSFQQPRVQPAMLQWPMKTKPILTVAAPPTLSRFSCLRRGASSAIGSMLLAAGCLLPSPLGAEVLLRDTFALGERPTSNNGKLVEARVGKDIHDFWPTTSTQPGARWIGVDPDRRVPTWEFAAASNNPHVPAEAGGGNGVILGRADAVGLLPFSPPNNPYRISAYVVPIFGTVDWVAIGFTSSPVANANFGSFGQIWIRLNGQGEFDVFVLGNATPQVSGTAALRGFNRLELFYEPGSRLVGGAVNDVPFEPFTLGSAPNIRYAGVEAHNTSVEFQLVDYFTVETVDASQPVAPSILAHPVSLSVTEGGSATFSMVAAGTAPLGYQWRKDDVNLDGETAPTLALSGLSLSQAGDYAVVVSNSAGTVTSQPARLDVLVPIMLDYDQSAGMVHIRFRAAEGLRCRLEYADTFSEAWAASQLQPVQSSDGLFSFSEHLENVAARFYRLRYP
jgi:hypothetical protein